MKKLTLILIAILSLILISSFAIAKGTNWYDKKLPSTTISPTVNASLIQQEKYIWNTTKWWEDKDCYYFDLYIGNTTNITWSDTNRELTCTKQTLVQSDIDTLELANVAWTLEQLGMVPTTTTITPTYSKKGENLKTGKITDNGVVVN